MHLQGHSSYPTAADYEQFLRENGLVLDGFSGDMAGPVGAAVRIWERNSEYKPFLVQEPSERRFTPPGPNHGGERSYTALLIAGGGSRGGGRLLTLESGLVGEPSSVTLNDVAQVRDADFELLPENADAEGTPWTMLKFTRPVYGAARSIAITGLWGYCAPPPLGQGLPHDVFEAIMSGAAALHFYARPNVADLQSISRDGLSEQFEIASTVTADQRGRALAATFDNAWKGFRRGY